MVIWCCRGDSKPSLGPTIIYLPLQSHPPTQMLVLQAPEPVAHCFLPNASESSDSILVMMMGSWDKHFLDLEMEVHIEGTSL